MDKGCYGDIWTWVHDEDLDQKVLHIRKKTEKFFFAGRFVQLIELPDHDLLIGIEERSLPEGEAVSRQIIRYHKLSEIEFVYDSAIQE